MGKPKFIKLASIGVFILVNVTIIAFICKATVLAAITFMGIFAIVFGYGSYSEKKNREWIYSEFRKFLDSFEKNRECVFSQAEMEKVAPLIKENCYRNCYSWTFVFKGRTIISEDISFGTERKESVRSSDGDYNDVTVFDDVSNARAMKTGTDKTYPLIKFRCNNMKYGGSDESYDLRFGDEVIDRSYTITSDSEINADLKEMLNCIVPSLKKAAEYGLSFSLYENSLISYKCEEILQFYSSSVEMEPAEVERVISVLKNQLEVTKEIADIC